MINKIATRSCMSPAKAHCQKITISPTTPKNVESIWWYNMHIYISCVTILQSFIKIGQAFLEELRSQSYSDGRTDGRTQTTTMSLRRFAVGDKKGIRAEYIRLFKPEIIEFKRMGGRH
jgi:hypothetical protein